MIQMKWQQAEDKFYCTDCNYESFAKQAMEKHIESKHISPGVICQICHKISPTRHALRMHLKRMHNTLPSCL